MPVYSIESPRSVPRLAHANVVADTSYTISLCVDRLPALTQFHSDAILHRTDFFINRTIRLEFLKNLRKATIIGGINECVRNNPAITNRYGGLLGHAFRSASLRYDFEKIYKDHVKNDDVTLILDPNIDIEAQENGFLNYAKLNYY